MTEIVFEGKNEALRNFLSAGIKDAMSRGPDYLSHHEKVIARLVAVLIFEFTTAYSGLTSAAAIIARAKGKLKGWHKEHYYPRQKAGEYIVQHFAKLGRFRFKDLEALLSCFCVVHHTTPHEGQLLTAYHKNHPYVSWEESYAACGIQLRDRHAGMRTSSFHIRFPDLFKKEMS